MTEHAVVIAGGGPAGLMLGAELTLAGIDAIIVERRVDQELDSSRSGGPHSRTIEVLDQRGVAERFVSAGQPHPAVGYAYLQLDISDFPTRHNYLLALWQRDLERILAGWVDKLGLPIRRGCEVVGSPRTAPASLSNCRTTPRFKRSTSSAATESASTMKNRLAKEGAHLLALIPI